MGKYLLVIIVSAVALASPASWYWPFGSDEKDEPRLSELMEPASLLIEEASDLAGDGKVSEAVEKYRAALAELDKVEAENPDRVNKPEFATLKTKRAYIGAAIDAMLLTQARDNAKTVAVSDTSELERRLKAERGGKAEAPAADASKPEEFPEVKEAAAEARRTAQAAEKRPKKVRRRTARAKREATRPLTRREQAMRAIAEGDYATADRLIGAMLDEKPNNALALNLKAVRESSEGRFKEAEATLDQAIQSNPKDYNAYYNMALLFLQADRVDGARRYYETGRALGGPADAELEAAFK